MGRMLNYYEEKIKYQESNKEESKMMYLLTIYWKLMDDLDKGNKGYKIKSWKYKDYEKLLLRLDEINLNQEEYRMYFRELIEFYSNQIINKNDE
tara:strand:+ start:200 stop:481 length:282 start_codon:yes stop_codon:yes gene_type:complete